MYKGRQLVHYICMKITIIINNIIMLISLKGNITGIWKLVPKEKVSKLYT